MARRYALASRGEAQASLRHPILGPRLIKCTELVNRVEERSAHQILGSQDDLKFHSSVTLFRSPSLGLQRFKRRCKSTSVESPIPAGVTADAGHWGRVEVPGS
jgi:uncharacterized protein (DUF1810 family)